MKKMNYLLLFLTSLYGFSQVKSTGVVNLGFSNMTANLSLSSITSEATLVLTGPSDRYFALQFGIFGSKGGMKAGEDMVYFDGTNLVDGNMVGVNVDPVINETQNWTITSNVMNGNLRTVTAKRLLFTGDTKDYAFLSSATTIDFVGASSPTRSYILDYHGSRRDYVVGIALANLGVEDFSLAATSVYPNPSNGSFNISAKSGLDKINVYTQVGAFVKTIELPKNSLNAELSLNGFQTGIYLIELEGETGKAWKKIAVNN